MCALAEDVLFGISFEVIKGKMPAPRQHKNSHDVEGRCRQKTIDTLQEHVDFGSVDMLARVSELSVLKFSQLDVAPLLMVVKKGKDRLVSDMARVWNPCRPHCKMTMESFLSLLPGKKIGALFSGEGGC